MKNPEMTICLMMAVLVIAAGEALGLIEFKDGGTHDIDYEIRDDVRVDWETPGVHTRVNWLSGAVTLGFLRGYEDSIINISGGSIVESLWAYDRSQVTFSDGSIEDRLFARDSSHVTMSGGWIGLTFQAHENSEAVILGGEVKGGLAAVNHSQVTISGGAIREGLSAYDSSQVGIIGGLIDGELIIWGGSRAAISGGSIASRFLVFDNAVITIYGSHFAVDGQTVAYGELTSVYGGPWYNEPSRHLTGTLASGELLDNDFFIGNVAKIVLTIYYNTLTINLEPNDVGIDTITPSVGPHDCAGGWGVSIKAERFVNCPDVYTFDHWEGDVNDPNSSSTTVYMDADKKVTALFVDARKCGDECHPYPLGDIDKNCIVDFNDFGLFALTWLECTKPECD